MSYSTVCIFLLMFQTVFRLSDAAINVLFSFFSLFFTSLARIVPDLPQYLLINLPKSKKDACAFSNCENGFNRYVCCLSCHSIYQWDDCLVHEPNGQLRSKLCPFQRFPNHPQPRHRQECGHSLMKQVKSLRGMVFISASFNILVQFSL